MQEETAVQHDLSEWKGILVFADFINGRLHPATLELISKARELNKILNQTISVLIIGHATNESCESIAKYGVDNIYVCDHKSLQNFNILTYTKIFIEYVKTYKPSIILVAATNFGRCLAPRVAAYFQTGMTADCTILDIQANGNLIQTRPAFGGNIMAKIITPNTRPQICTVRYKVFAKSLPPTPKTPKIITLPFQQHFLSPEIECLNLITKQKEVDLVDAERIIVCGRGFSKKADLAMAYTLAELLDAQVGCTRPLIENNWMDSQKQIGLSGRTVKPKLIITLGVSGSVQFSAGMANSGLIIAINNNKDAQIFNVAHHGFVADIYEMLPKLINLLKARRNK